MFDIHSHILFGIDDGSESLDESIHMLKQAKDIGIEVIVATPHVFTSGYDTDIAKEKMEIIRPYADEIGIKLIQGFEYNFSAFLGDGIKRLGDFCFEGSRKILIEFKDGMFPPNWERLAEEIQWEGYDIIVAHPERYYQVQSDIGCIFRTVQLGCQLQLDGLSLNSGMFSSEKQCSKRLLSNGYVRWVASDAHSAKDYEDYGKIVKKYFKNNEFFFEPSYNELGDI